LRELVGAAERFEKQAFVFVHGFNVGFDAAAYRTAQIVYDLGFDGAPVFYSWPSRGGIKEYEYDQNSARQARAHLRSFLELVRSQSGGTWFM
jgi:esterase/lipase superfamily enzyme